MTHLKGVVFIFACVILILSTAFTSCSGFHSSHSGEISKNTPVRKLVVPGTGQSKCYDNVHEISCPMSGQDFYGQDSQNMSPKPSYTDNKDGTVTDNLTGLIWQKSVTAKMTYTEALQAAKDSRLGGEKDWRLPTVTEIYSLINFNGHFGPTAAESIPFIDTSFFDFSYGSETGSTTGQADKRWIDVQLWSSTIYTSTTVADDRTVFGVNFADGRIKGYPQYEPGSQNTIPRKMLARFVRGSSYGVPDLHLAEPETSVDRSSGLMWQQKDDGITRNWKQALKYCTQLNLAGYTNWRLPNAKELQYIVDYSRSPKATGTAAIYPGLEVSNIESYFWSATTILDGPADIAPKSAVYLAFGRAQGYMESPPGSGLKKWVDVHGAGAQRADPKDGNPKDYPEGFGPQGDDVRIFNYVRCVRSMK